MRVDRVRAQSLVSDASRNLEARSARHRMIELRDHGPHGLPKTPTVDTLKICRRFEEDLARLLPG